MSRRPVRAAALVAAWLIAASSGAARAFAAPPATGAAAPGAAPSERAEQVEGIEIDRVEITGVTLFDRAAIEGAMEITAGDRLARTKVVRTAENFQALYSVRGYERVQVRSELLRQKGEGARLENVLRFALQEGLPTRVASVRLEAGQIRDPGFARYWRELQGSLTGKLGVKPGEVLDQERSAGARRAIQDALASEEFIGARVDEARVATVPAPPESALPPPAEAKRGAGDAAPVPAPRAAARWVELTYRIDLGDRVSFGFRGNTVFTRSRLLGMIDEQRLVGFGRDYVQSIRTKLEDEYRAQGYPQARVRPFTFERPAQQERHVTYEITEGARARIAGLEFEGNLVFPAGRLRDEFRLRAPYLVQQDVYVERDVERAAELLIEWIRSQGYLAAKLVTINRVYEKSGQAVRLTLYLYEGDQTRVDDIALSGFTVLTRDEVSRILGLRVGDPLNLFQFNEGLELVKAAYRDRGYLDFRLVNEGGENVVRYRQENRLAGVRLEAFEGPQYRLSRVDIEGLSEVKEVVVRREISLGEGDVLEERRIAESEARLRKLGIFGVVTTHLVDDPARPGHKILRVSVQEGTAGLVEGGLGIRNDLGGRVFGQVAYTNLFRRNHTLSLGASVNRRFDAEFCDNVARRDGTEPEDRFCDLEYQVATTYTAPWALLGPTTLRAQLSAGRTQYRILDAFTLGFSVTLERRLLDAFNLTGLLTYSLERTKQFNTLFLVDDRDLTIGAITPALILDLRDSTLAPTRGFFGSASLEYATPALLSQELNPPVGYYRFQMRLDQHIPLGSESGFFMSFRTGYERNNELPPDGSNDPTYAIPLIKQFTLGGAGSLRGFQEQELTTNLAIRGSLAYVNYRFQLDLPFSGPLKWGPFLDAGNLLVDRYSFGILRYGAGVGFRYKSPVGPVNFDWGFKLNRQPGDIDSNVFHFSIGVI